MKKKTLFFMGLLALKVCTYGQTQAIPDSQHVYHSITEALLNPDRVHKLDLSKKKLTAIPVEVFQFRNLKVLSLSRNKIKNISGDIGKLSSLESLDISRNYLTDLPPEIGKLTNLKELILYQNEIDTIPAEVGQLSSLERLDLWDNELSTLPESLKNLKKLQVIDLRGILFNEKQQLYFRELLPGITIYLSPGCNTCKDP